MLQYKDLHFTTPINLLKSMGYTFQKLYARNYKTYRKEIEGFTIWLWEKGKTIEINDWYNYTANVIEFYKNNVEQWKIENTKLPKPRQHIVLFANHNTGEVILKDMAEYYEAMFRSDDVKSMDKYYEKYEGWRDVVLHLESFEPVLKEVEILTR